MTQGANDGVQVTRESAERLAGVVQAYENQPIGDNRWGSDLFTPAYGAGGTQYPYFPNHTMRILELTDNGGSAGQYDWKLWVPNPDLLSELEAPTNAADVENPDDALPYPRRS